MIERPAEGMDMGPEIPLKGRIAKPLLDNNVDVVCAERREDAAQFHFGRELDKLGIGINPLEVRCDRSHPIVPIAIASASFLVHPSLRGRESMTENGKIISVAIETSARARSSCKRPFPPIRGRPTEEGRRYRGRFIYGLQRDGLGRGRR